MAKRGDWVEIHSVVLRPEERALSALPEDTQHVPLELWVKGWLESDAALGDEVCVKTRTGRIASGTLENESPHYTHSFGDFVPELQKAGDDAFALLFGGEQP